MNVELDTVAVHHGDNTTVGYLLFESRGLIVLLNSIPEGAELGEPQNRVARFLEPEGSIMVIPGGTVADLGSDREIHGSDS